MARRTHNPIDDLRGGARLAVDATRGVADLIEAVHLRIAGGPAVLGQPLDGPIAALLGLSYGSVRGVAGLVGAGLDRVLGLLAPLVKEGLPGAEREAVLAALNGVVGDYLEQTGNPLALAMSLRSDGGARDVDLTRLADALPAAGPRPLVMVHGSSMSPRRWQHLGHDHGAALAEVGHTPLYLRYNSGLHISTNGRALAALLEALLDAWPVPVEELTLLGHSMGGLVARSAIDAAEAAGLRWRARLGALVCLGTPHLGAPLERGGNLLDAALGISSYSAPFARLGRIRSAGVTDLRHGSLRDEDWQGRDRFERGGALPAVVPLPRGVRCFAVAASTSKKAVERLAGDGLVPVDSALGRHSDAARTLAFPEEHRWIAMGMGHIDLLDREEVSEVLRRWLG